MKTWFAILSLFFCLACMAADKPKSVAAPLVSKEDRKNAEKEFKNAQDLQRAGKPDDALIAVLKAQELMPGNVEFMTMGEMLRQQIVGEHMEAGNHLAAAGDPGALHSAFAWRWLLIRKMPMPPSDCMTWSRRTATPNTNTCCNCLPQWTRSTCNPAGTEEFSCSGRYPAALYADWGRFWRLHGI